MPIDINELRDYKGGDPSKWRKYMEQRFKDPSIVDQALLLDMDWRNLRSTVDDLRKAVNKLQKDVIAPKKKAKEDCEAEVAQMKEMQKTIKEKEAELPLIEESRDKILSRIGNLVDPEVPIIKTEDADNLVFSIPCPIMSTSPIQPAL
jgi:seryl-tRNA synthetase